MECEGIHKEINVSYDIYIKLKQDGFEGRREREVCGSRAIIV